MAINKFNKMVVRVNVVYRIALGMYMFWVQFTDIGWIGDGCKGML